MNKRKIRRWHKTYGRYELTGVIYRREHYVYRNLTRWLTHEETRELISELAMTFGVPVPKTIISDVNVAKLDEYTAAFKMQKDGTHWLHFRAINEFSRRVTYWANDGLCRQYELYYYNIPARTVRNCAILHEFAHYLCALWWGHSPHDNIFLAVNEALHDWYQRKRNKKGVKTRYRLKLTNGKDED